MSCFARGVGSTARWRGAILPGAIGALFAAAAAAQDLPAKPIHVIVPYTPGGAPDLMARPYAQKLQLALGQPAIVDNRPGGNTTIGYNAVARATPDGTTLGLVTFSFALSVAFADKPPYHPVRDFAAVGQVSKSTAVIVGAPTLPFKTIRELIAYAKDRPGEVNYGIVSPGTSGALAALSLQSMGGIKMTPVMYKGAAQSVAAAASGEIHVTFTNIGAIVSLAKAGKITVLAVTSPKRASALPSVPTVAETIPGYAEESYFGLVSAAKTPPAAINRLSRETIRIIESEDIRKAYEGLGLDAAPMGADEFGKFIAAQVEKWGAVFKDNPLEGGG